ncbi:hypothetical protein JCM3770_000378 [Rhodotorula araucariae]
MASSLLWLPDELLGHIIDKALDDYAPSLYKQRQDTARALCLVNKRIGEIAQCKIVEAVQIKWKNDEDQPTFASSTEMHYRTRHLLIDYPWNKERAISRSFLPSFHALRDVRLVRVCGVRLEIISQLPELHILVLFQAHYSATVPLVALNLERLTLYFCAEALDVIEPSCLLDTPGCPSLRYLYLGRRTAHSLALCSTDLVDQLDKIVLELFDESGRMHPGTWPQMTVDGAVFQKTLVDCQYEELELFNDETVIKEPVHVRVYDGNSEDPSAKADFLAACCCYLADCLPNVFPNLETLYLIRALDTSHVAQHRNVVEAVDELAVTCALANVEIVFEHEVIEVGDTRESPHFAARCRRMRASQR